MTTAAPAPARVLVVDDTPANLALLFETLTQAGHRLLVAENGADALAILAHSPVDLILLDVIMPVLDGFATCARLKANPTWADLPVLFMTSVDTPGEKVRAFEAGAADYIVKPVYPPEVLARVEAHLRIRALTRDLAARNAELESEVELRLDAETQLARSLDRAILIAAPDGQIVFASQLARVLLAKYFPGHTPARFPAALTTENAQATSGPDTLLVRRFGAPSPAAAGDLIAWFLEEKNAPPGPAALMQLGLTARMAEVLYWVAQGKTNAEIGIILDASARTIAKHIERIFQRLGTENRASAMVLATEILRPSK
jgi:DNA-binding response OmpR family regulator/DNA-binding CsgD family transcriptional regulator